MAFASNTNFSSAINPIDVGQPTKVVPPDISNGFKPEGAVAAEHLNYCFNRLETVVQTFTAGGTWTKPTGAVWVEMVLVGGGEGGSSGVSGVGGEGGNAALPCFFKFPASMLPASLTITIGAGSNSGGFSGGATTAENAGIIYAYGPDWNNAANVANWSGVTGGAGGTAAAGSSGQHSGHGPGGAGGTAGNPGARGLGYGAGGGGGRNNGGSSAGGGGGAGGYGTAAIAASGSTTTGGAGGAGVCIITTWREIT